MKLLSTLVLFANTAHAETLEPWKRGLQTGSVTTLSAIGGFALGWVLGDYARDLDGTAPLIGSMIGGTLAPPIAATLMADSVDSNKLLVGGLTGAMSIAGITCVVSGFNVEQYDLAVVGGGLIVLGTGFTAGISAGLFPNIEISASINPIVTPQYRGLAFHTEF